MANNTSHHILNTSTNLLGFCLFVITSFHITNQAEMHYIDELTSIIAILLGASSIFSFISIRTTNLQREKQLENIADYLFIIALIGVLTIILLIAFNYVG